MYKCFYPKIFIFLITLIFVCIGKENNKKSSFEISIIPEMQNITIIDTVSEYPSNIGESILKEFKKNFKYAYEDILDFIINTKLIKHITIWAVKETDKYVYKKRSIDSLKFKPVCISKSFIIYETVLDTLPSHSDIVERYLKIYSVYNLSSNKIDKIIITIRGTMNE